MLAGCGGSGSRTATGPAPVGPTPKPPSAGGLAVGLTESNANLYWTARPGFVEAPGFARARRELERMRPAYLRLVVDWATVQPNAGGSPRWDVPQDGCLRGTSPCSPYAGIRDERLQTAETSSSSATRKEEPQPQAAITLGFSTLKPAPCRLST